MKTYSKFFLLIFCLACFVLDATSQIKIDLNIKSANGEQIRGAELSVVASDSTVLFEIISVPNYTLTLPSSGLYEISISHMAYEPYYFKKEFTNDSTLFVTLDSRTIQLEEVTVEAKAPTKITATGEIFQLSQKAKKSGDPYRALSEIPLLNVDIINQKITTNSGDELLVLIDGRLQNSGISPIDPKFIESVEISEVVSARFLKMGVNKIVNIKLKKNRPMYSFTDIRTRHDIPIREGFGGANFEMGRKKIAVTGSVFYSYLHDDKIATKSNEQTEDISRILEGEQINNSRSWEGSFMTKWIPTKSDYFSSIIKFLSSDDGTKKLSNGQYVKNTNYHLKYDYYDNTIVKGVLAALYHEHTFRNDNILTTFFKYNYSPTNVKENLAEEFNGGTHEMKIHEESLRNQYTLAIDFDTQEQKYGNINIGNEFEYTNDKNWNRLIEPSPSVPVDRWSNYTYLGYSNNWKRLFYMASIGVENLGVKVLEHTNISWEPRISTSLSLKLPYNQSIRIAYNMDNTLPPSSLLFTFNHSTNPLLRVEGNPYLIPEQGHEIGLNYNKDFNKIRFMAFTNHTLKRNIIEPYIYSDNNTQIQSYKNNGTYKENQIGGSMRFGWNNLILFIAANHTWKSFNGQETKSSVGVNGYLRWDFGNFFVYSNIEWKNRDYTAIATTEYSNPVQAHIQVAWQATKQIYISLGLPYFWGRKCQTTKIDQSVFKSWQHDCFKGMSLRPWLLISWTLRKNAKEALPDKMPPL